MQGGFAGLMLRLKADGHDKIDLYGPPGLLWLLSHSHIWDPAVCMPVAHILALLHIAGKVRSKATAD